MPRKAPAVVPPSTGERICCFCGLKDNNELEYGKIHEYNGIITHYYCLLLSSNMQQRGSDDEGILGFLPEDINKELKRGKKLACCYCKKIGATLGCCNTKCKKIFHFPCGLKAGSLHQFFGEFRSYCRNHRPKQKIDSHVAKEISQRDNKICYICYDAVNPHDTLGTLWAPCCKKNAWFHRTCVQQLAMSAGYFFKCPLCNNKIEFQKAMLDSGIFIPSQDASWELVPNAFEELLYRHNRCDAKKCMCPKGREHTSPNAKWELTLCRTCGSQGIHMACGNLKWAKPAWECLECTSILNKPMKSEVSKKKKILRSLARFHEKPRDEGLLTDDDSDDDKSSDSSSNSDISVGGLPEMPTEAAFSTASMAMNLSLDKIDEGRKKNVEDKLIMNHDKPNGLIENSRKSSITMCSETSRVQFSEELPPLTKKPRISDSDDSDDDIIVLSGPSHKECTATNALKSPIKGQRTTEHSWGFGTGQNDNKNEKEKMEKETQTESKNLEQASRFSVDSLSKTRVSSEIERRVPVEIDLSDSEVVVTDNSSMIVNSESASNILTDTPEWNIKITNVTSLAPEVFASVPEVETQMEDHSMICQSSTSQVSQIEQNNPNHGSQQTHEQMQIVRFDGTNANNLVNSVLYGLTIPGTNNTVPLILSSSSELGKPSTIPQTLQEIWSNSILKRSPPMNYSAIPSTPTIRPAPGPKSRKAERTARAEKAARVASAIHAAKNAAFQNNETQPINLAQKMTSPLCYSVPLEAVVNETISINRSNSKTKNSIDFGPIAKNQGQPSKLNKKVETSSKTTTPTSTSVGSSKIPKSTHPMTPSNNSIKNSVGPLPVSQIYAFMQTESSSVPTTNMNIPNGLVSTKFLQTEPKNSFPHGQVSGGVTKSNAFKSGNSADAGVNTTWPIIQEMVGNKNLSLAYMNGNSGMGNSLEKSQVQKMKNSDNEMELYIIPTDGTTQVSSENCDGNAGSGPADQPTTAIAANTKLKRSRNITTSPCQLVAASDNRDRSIIDKSIEAKYDTKNAGTPEYPSAPKWNNCNSSNRTGLMNKTINLRDLKFTICRSNMVKMTLYETYSVNINVDSGSKCKYTPRRLSNISQETSSDSCVRKTIRSSLIRENDFLRNVNSDSENLPGSTTIFATDNIDNDDDAVLNQSENKSQGNHKITDKINPTNELSRNEVNSRGQDELKENLDPIPASTNLTNNTPSTNDRKSKIRLRTGTNNHTMQLLNELETRETISEENDKSPRKLGKHDSLLTVNPSKISYNCWKDNLSRTLVVSNEGETHSQTISADRSVENGAKNATKRGSLIDENATVEISDHVKRPKYLKDGSIREPQDCDKFAVTEDSNSDTYTSANHLVSNAEKSQNRKSPRVRQAENPHINNVSNNRKKTRANQANGKASLCCKVSIDLSRIRSIVAQKLNSMIPKSEDGEFCKWNGESCSEKKLNEKYVFHSKTSQALLMTRSRSLNNLASFHSSSIERSSVVESRKWKSSENLWSISIQARHKDSLDGLQTISVAEKNRRGCKRKTRSFEKHDCVR